MGQGAVRRGRLRLEAKGKGGPAGGWLPAGLPERLHFWGLLTALASEPVHILGGCPHHLVCLKLTLVFCSVHLEGEAGKAMMLWSILRASSHRPAQGSLC